MFKTFTAFGSILSLTVALFAPQAFAANKLLSENQDPKDVVASMKFDQVSNILKAEFEFTPEQMQAFHEAYRSLKADGFENPTVEEVFNTAELGMIHSCAMFVVTAGPVLGTAHAKTCNRKITKVIQQVS